MQDRIRSSRLGNYNLDHYTITTCYKQIFLGDLNAECIRNISISKNFSIKYDGKIIFTIF